jgi:molecular chaperone DnaK (HSP70)
MADQCDVAEFESETNLIIAIDFGTTFTGVAYSYRATTSSAVLTNAELRKINQNMHIIREWPSQSRSTFDKVQTVLAYKNGEPGNWGESVRRGDNPRMEYFKLGLQENLNSAAYRNSSESSSLGGYLNDHDWRHPLLPNKRALDVTSDYLKCVLQHVLTDQLPKKYGTKFLQNQNISYVLTVPAVWSDTAKERTRQAAVRAGIPSRKITLVTEPEAAANYCSTLCTEVDLQEQDRFVVCDAGGGTVVRPLPWII